jgi:four helix bundle protein
MDALENLGVWKRSCRLSVELYKLLRDFGFRDQVTRSALSVPSNIAEGYERDSSKEFSRFLKIAKGSCGELRTQLYIGTEASARKRVSSRRRKRFR